LSGEWPTRRIVALRIARNAQGLLQIRIPVDIDVADALGVAQDGDVQRLLLDAAHQLGGAPRDDQVDVVLHGQQVADLLARGNLEWGSKGLHEFGKSFNYYLTCNL